jgi:hypothetical protein
MLVDQSSGSLSSRRPPALVNRLAMPPVDGTLTLQYIAQELGIIPGSDTYEPPDAVRLFSVRLSRFRLGMRAGSEEPR